MEARPFVAEKDFTEICHWWKLHAWEPLSLDYLPALGVVVEADGVKYAAGWLYRTDSKFCIMEWIVSNPETDREKRSLAVDLLLETLVQIAKNVGFGAISSSTKSKGLLARCAAQGFQTADTEVTTILRRLE